MSWYAVYNTMNDSFLAKYTASRSGCCWCDDVEMAYTGGRQLVLYGTMSDDPIVKSIGLNRNFNMDMINNYNGIGGFSVSIWVEIITRDTRDGSFYNTIEHIMGVDYINSFPVEVVV